MKKLILPLVISACSGWAAAQLSIDRIPLGTGTPGNSGVENAIQWDDDIYHVPQYMPGYPTAATIFPRAVSVLCTKNASGINCKGYNWAPEMGRAEYLMIRPVIARETSAQP